MSGGLSQRRRRARLQRYLAVRSPPPGTFTALDLRQYDRLIALTFHKDAEIRVIATQDLAAFRRRQSKETLAALDAAVLESASA